LVSQATARDAQIDRSEDPAKLRALPLTFQNQQYIMDHHRQRNEAKKRRVTIVSKSAFLRAVIEAMNEVNLMRKKDPRRLTEDMLFSPHPPEPTAASIFNYYQGLRRGRQTIPDVPSTARIVAIP
jgi:hypothetical protein